MKKTVQTRIFEVLESRGQSVTWFAHQIEIERSRLYRIEWGERPMPEGYLDRAAKVLQVSSHSLLLLSSELSERNDNLMSHHDPTERVA